MRLSRFSLALSSSLLSVTLSQAAIVSQVSDIPNNIKFDFIIIGGGNSGNVVANRLSENPKVQVLVLEAGPSHEGVLVAEVPFFATELVQPSPYEWNYTTTPQPGLAGRSIAYPRGHILGGCSITNWLVYTRGSNEDFDRYAKVSGDQGWSWKGILPYFKKSEKWSLPADGHNITGQFDPTMHGYKGEVAVSLPGYGTPIDQRVLQATSQMGGDYKFNLDYNSGNQLGISWAQTTIDGSERASSASSYLAPKFLARKNLWVAVNAQVSRVIQSGGGPVPAFRTVEFRQRSGGPLKTLTAKQEVILSAGTVGTPHILLNSGIGNAKTLKAIGVKPLVDLPDVGQNMHDHPVLGNPWLVNSTNTFETLRRDTQLADDAITQWQVNKTGPLVNTILDHIGFVRLNKKLVPKPDTAAGPTTPHYEMIISNGIPPAPAPPAGNFLVLTTIVVSPSSRGSVTLRSKNPFDSPVIDPGLLKTNFDKLVMREAVKGVTKFVSAPAWSGYVIGPAGAFADATNDTALDAYIANNSGTLFHPVGTASFSAKGAKTGVTDPDLTVKKVAGLRVVDVSVLPYVPSAHTQAAAYAIGERASDLIKKAYKL
ncbi:Pyranose dehydrogenase 1 [Hypsizygus marmoreus]|uniref:Pyranose dehydrogenase 1 n=1 Tax=Hypsizygus marmoreus TaxID=39966 RepID=A0A369K1B6_HYPMA|nr:Pyranose dehydrogenase 1 [Hypsizygus marmoreus]